MATAVQVARQGLQKVGEGRAARQKEGPVRPQLGRLRAWHRLSGWGGGGASLRAWFTSPPGLSSRVSESIACSGPGVGLGSCGDPWRPSGTEPPIQILGGAQKV